MSCNGCRVLRKGCSDSCILRPCLQFIESAEAQGHATVFVAKFFGRAGLMSFISAVSENQRPALFRSLLFDAAGRTVNPVNGAVGLLGTGNWHVCQAAVETVLRGGALKPIPEFLTGGGAPSETDDASECTDVLESPDAGLGSRSPAQKRRRFPDLDLNLTPAFGSEKGDTFAEKRRLGSPSMNSGESQTTTCGNEPDCEIKLLNLFN